MTTKKHDETVTDTQSVQVDDQAQLQANFLKAVAKLPTVVVDTEEKARAFFEDDGGY
ncbi:hypothetical protein [Ligilactobacillus agilis]|uniref:hypothetical protein n=1 Tax=Ligilactobacillus agilis TaxID=1601 RepID=UPI001437566D|nr:hypothetical protein [Ligilactobacillus agilis]MBM6764018.1 hypothetical protein [Ligilactobacillus agilis]MDY4064479.1 hypothetical protein [Ligilactobacillus agilis]GET10240.1 hypothetical protein SN10121_07300 [Ligilactobacillus agilis]GET18310.1 hypothetical protein PTL465_06280 [Ligilactobacillus agilis]